MTDKGEQSESNQDEGFGTLRGRLLKKDNIAFSNKEEKTKTKTSTNSDK